MSIHRKHSEMIDRSCHWLGSPSSSLCYMASVCVIQNHYLIAFVNAVTQRHILNIILVRNSILLCI